MLWNKKIEDEEKLPELPFQARQIQNNTNSQIIETNEDEEHYESIKSSEKQALPAFPDSPINKGFSQSAIKEAVSSEDEKIPLPPQEETIDAFNSLETKSISPPKKDQNTFIQSNPFLNSSVEFEKKVEPQTITKMKSENKTIKMVEIEHDYPLDAPHPPSMQKPQIPKLPKMIPKIEEQKIEEVVKFTPVEKIEEKEKTTDVFVKIDKFYTAKKALASIKQDVKEIENLLAKIRETKLKEERELSSWEKNILAVKDEINKVSESLFDKII